MTPGRRANTLKMLLRARNWQKHIRTREPAVLCSPLRFLMHATAQSLTHKLVEVLPLAREPHKELHDLSNTLRNQDTWLLTKWEGEYTTWTSGNWSKKPAPSSRLLQVSVQHALQMHH
jgi:hypothetical protein